MYSPCRKKALNRGKAAVIKKSTRFEKYRYAPIFLVLFGLVFVRYCYYGLEYFYQLDDYIQYHNFTAYNQDLWAMLAKSGMLAARPLAAVCDTFVWSHLYSSMIVAVGIISAMYAASAIFLHRVFAKHFGTGFLFFVIYALLPLGFEGTYWVSASSRIVVGLFFASASLLFFELWCEDGKKYNLILFSVIQFISFCFYEQVVLFSGAATLIIMLCYAKKYSRSRASFGLLMFVNAALYVGITELAPSGINSGRSELFLPWQSNYSEQLVSPLIGQLKSAFISGSAGTFGKGLLRGFRLMLSEPNAIYVIIVFALCASLFFITKKIKRSNISFFPEFFSGVFLALVPLTIFFLIKSPWFGLRNTVPSFCGLALMCDALFDLIFGKFKRGYITEAALISVLALLCCTASVSELHDYRETTKADTAIVTAAVTAIKNTENSYNKSVWLLNVDPSYVSDGNIYYHEHDSGVTSSRWAMTGAVAAISGTNDKSLIPDVIPISAKSNFEADKSEVGASPVFWYQAGHFIPAKIVNIGSDLWMVTNKTGEQLGALQNRYGLIYLEVK